MSGYGLSERRLKALDKVDQMPGDIRAVVHEFGLPIVEALMDNGVRDPANMRHLVHVIWQGSREPSAQPKRKLGGATRVMSTLDWVLMQAGAPITAARLVRVLAQGGMYIIPREPSQQMVHASLEEVSAYNVRCTKEEKHRRRLRAALQAGVDHLWPHLRKTA